MVATTREGPVAVPSQPPDTSAVPASSSAAWLFVLAGALTLALAALFPIWTNDLFGHLAAGRQIVQLGHIPDHDSFSFYFEQAQPWRNHNWLSCVLFYLAYVAGGVALLVWLKVLLCAVLGGVLVASVEDRVRQAPIAWLVLLWAVPSVRSRFTTRPHLFGLVFCAVLMYALSALSKLPASRKAWGIIAALGVMQVAWVNLHGSGPMAFLLTGAFLVGHHGDRERQKHFAALLLVQLVASALTPFGPALLLETFHHVSSEGTRGFIGEWGPLSTSDNFWDVPAVGALALLLLWIAPALWRSGFAARSWLLVVVGLSIMAYRSLRFVAEPLLLGAPCLAAGLSLRFSAWSSLQRRVTAGAFALLGVLAVGFVTPQLPPYQPLRVGLSSRNLPMQPGRWLAAHRPRARIASVMEDCWYLSFAVPRGLVLIDGRQAVYPLEVLESVTEALKVPKRLFALLDDKHADAVVLRHDHPHHVASIAALLQRSDYGVATVGDRHVLFVRDLPREQAVVTLQPTFALRAFAPEQAPQAWLELQSIGDQPGAREYVGFQRALLRVSPYLRAGGYDGLAPITSPEQRARHVQALRDLAPALVPDENHPTAQVLATLLQLSLCELDAAERSLALARSEGENRHTIALQIELSIRKGELAAAHRTLTELSATGPDAWLDLLRAEAGAPQQAICRH